MGRPSSRRASALLAALMLVALPACAQRAEQEPQAPPPPAAAEPTPLRIHGLRAVLELAPILRAAETSKQEVLLRNGNIMNLWRDEGPPPAGVEGESYGAIRAPYWPGHADLAGNAETQGLRQSVPHPDTRIIMTVTEGIYRMVARRSSGIARVADLKGKRVATLSTTSAAFFLHQELARAGLTEADVTIVSAMPKEGADMLIAGKVDAFAMYEPEPERAFQALGADAIELPNSGVYRELYNLNTTTTALNDPVKRAQIVAFARELIAACAEAVTKPDRMIALIAEAAGYDEKLVHTVWHHHRFPCAIPADMLDILEAEEQWLAKLEKRRARTREELAPILDPSIVEEARRPQ